MQKLKPFRGTIASIEQFGTTDDCTLIFTISEKPGSEEVIRLVITPDTYIVGNETLHPGDPVTAWIDANRPVILIYPPQYEAVAIAREIPGQNLKADYFNGELISSDGMLQLHPSTETAIIQTNGQVYPGNPANHNIIVIYGPSTRSIPAQTTPYRMIVFCK